MTILILAPPSDEHAVAVGAELRRRGERYVFFDVAEVPQHARVSVSIEPGEDLSAVVERARDPFDLADVETIWLRRVGAPQPPALSDRWFAVAECQHLLVGLAQALADRRWVNPLAALAMDGGWGKVRQLQVAREVGLEVPRTLMTSDQERARAFVASCPGGAVYKPFASVEGRDHGGQVTAIFTTAITPDMDLGSVAHAPVIMQERVAKAFEVRATVMGERVFAVAIYSQEDQRSAVDYRRRYLDVPHAVHALPRRVEEALVASNASLGLVFSTCDLIVTPEGRYVYLESNQAGQFDWTGRKTGEPMIELFCDLLSGASAPLSPERRSG